MGGGGFKVCYPSLDSSQPLLRLSEGLLLPPPWQHLLRKHKLVMFSRSCLDGMWDWPPSKKK